MDEILSRVSLSLVLLSVLALCACGKSEPPQVPVAKPEPVAPAPEPAAAALTHAPTPAPVVQVASVTMASAIGADGTASVSTTTFTPKDTIYAVIDVISNVPSASIGVRWTYEGGQVVTEQSQTLITPGAKVSTFHISKPDGFPAGSYAVDVIIDGKSVSTTPFTVQ